MKFSRWENIWSSNKAGFDGQGYQCSRRTLHLIHINLQMFQIVFFGLLTLWIPYLMIKLMDCLFVLQVLEGRAYRLQHPWVGIVNRSQADINKNVDMIDARRKEQEYFATSPDYGHLAHKMGSEYLAKLLSQVLLFLLLFTLLFFFSLI